MIDDLDDESETIEPGDYPAMSQDEYLAYIMEIYRLGDVLEAMAECGGNAAAASNWLRVMGRTR